jgi:hypothetical protein
MSCAIVSESTPVLVAAAVDVADVADAAEPPPRLREPFAILVSQHSTIAPKRVSSMVLVNVRPGQSASPSISG